MCTKAVGDAFLMVAGGAQLAEGLTSSQEPFLPGSLVSIIFHKSYPSGRKRELGTFAS